MAEANVPKTFSEVCFNNLQSTDLKFKVWKKSIIQDIKETLESIKDCPHCNINIKHLKAISIPHQPHLCNTVQQALLACQGFSPIKVSDELKCHPNQSKLTRLNIIYEIKKKTSKCYNVIQLLYPLISKDTSHFCHVW